MTVPTTTGPVWASWTGDTPAALAGLFRQAAALIEAEGYRPCADGIFVPGRRPGHSVTTALDAAAAYACEHHPADAADLAEDAHARLAGFLHLAGLRTRRTSIHDLCDEVAAWEDCRPLTGYRSQAEAVACALPPIQPRAGPAPHARPWVMGLYHPFAEWQAKPSRPFAFGLSW